MTYVDGFVVAVPKSKLEEYKKMAELGGKVWMEHGALSYVEAVADDAPYGEVTSFPRAVLLKEDEVAILSFITYESREKRDEVCQKVMGDERLKGMMENPPFDGQRMIYGGFEGIVEL